MWGAIDKEKATTEGRRRLAKNGSLQHIIIAPASLHRSFPLRRTKMAYKSPFFAAVSMSQGPGIQWRSGMPGVAWQWEGKKRTTRIFPPITRARAGALLASTAVPRRLAPSCVCVFFLEVATANVCQILSIGRVNLQNMHSQFILEIFPMRLFSFSAA